MKGYTEMDHQLDGCMRVREHCFSIKIGNITACLYAGRAEKENE